jgi:hypothetical protein
MINGNTTIQISNWDKRQYKSDNVTERVRAYREKRFTETFLKRSNNVIDSDTDTDTESDSYSPAAPTFLNERQAEQIFTRVTSMATFPSKSRSDDLERIYALWTRDGIKAESVMQECFTEWMKRKYNKVNTAWLDWAISGEIPRQQQRKNGSDPRNTPTEEF